MRFGWNLGTSTSLLMHDEDVSGIKMGWTYYSIFLPSIYLVRREDRFVVSKQPRIPEKEITVCAREYVHVTRTVQPSSKG